MKQLFQSLKNGDVALEEIPYPACGSGRLLVRVTKSLVSIGTEKMLVDFGKAGWVDKARQQPEKVQQVLTKIKTDGIAPTVNAVLSKLDQPLPLGYSAVGVVEQIGAGVTEFKVGDRVVCNGPHAEFVVVPTNLAAKIPDEVSDDQAAFTVVGAIGLQGIRLANPTLGETVVVIGLGLIGLLSVQILLANGCNVVCYDFEKDKVDRANQMGAKAFQLGEMFDPVKEVLSCTQGVGADAVIITASNKSDEIISQSAQMCRVRGRVVLVGVIGLNLKRSDFYNKEISFQVSCSYGPGRYDSNYEDKNLDFPIGFVRWTEQRNFQAVLNLIKTNKLNTEKLITKQIPLAEASDFYKQLGENKSELGVVINYQNIADSRLKTVSYAKQSFASSDLSLSVLGAGQFASAVLLPLFEKESFKFHTLGSRTGSLTAHLAKKYSFNSASSDYDAVLSDTESKSILISTRHNSHATLVLQALKLNKNVFVEKPLALSLDELNDVKKYFTNSNSAKPVLMVGFNRRFSPLSIDLKKHLTGLESAKTFIMTVNAGAIPKNHWTQDLTVGGGRLVGEACHFIDLLRFLSDSPITDADVKSMRSEANDSFVISLKFKNGDLGVINYLSNGHKSFPKERLEVFVAGKIMTLDNFKSLSGVGVANLKYALSQQDKGHADEVKAFKQAVQKGHQPVSLEEIFEVSEWSVKLQEELNKQANV